MLGTEEELFFEMPRKETRSLKVLREVKQKSVNRERVSTACVIGLYSATGNEVVVRAPAKTTKKTLPHIQIEDTMIDSMHVSDIKVMPEYLGTDKRSQEAMVVNAVSDKLMKTLKQKYTKRRQSEKTIKMNIYETIEPFTELGFEEFGKAIISIICDTVKCKGKKRDQFVVLYPYDRRVLACLAAVEAIPNAITPTGGQLIESIKVRAASSVTSTEPRVVPPSSDVEEPIPMARQKELVNLLAFWYHQSLYEGSCLKSLSDFSQQLTAITAYLESVKSLQLPGIDSM